MFGEILLESFLTVGNVVFGLNMLITKDVGEHVGAILFLTEPIFKYFLGLSECGILVRNYRDLCIVTL